MISRVLWLILGVLWIATALILPYRHYPVTSVVCGLLFFYLGIKAIFRSAKPGDQWRVR